MGKSTVTVTWDPSLKPRLEAATKRGQMVLDTQILKDTDPYVPWADGILSGSAKRASDIGSGTLRWDGPYAAAQYYGLPNKSRDVHPQATTAWFEAAKASNKATWVRVAEQTVRMGI